MLSSWSQSFPASAHSSVASTNPGVPSVRDDRLDVVGHDVDSVESVEHRPEGLAQRDVEAVGFPIEIVADRPEAVVEVGDVVAHRLDVAHHGFHLDDHAVG